MKTFTKVVLMGAGAVAAYKIVRRKLAPDPRLYYAGKAVVVTGGASGIGRALVEELTRRRARVLVVDVNAPALAELSQNVPAVDTLVLDLAVPGAPDALIAEAVARLGRIDIVFSNAGIVWAAPFLSMTEADIAKQIDVNFTMQVLLTRELLPYFLDRGGGVIAYTGSLSAHVHSPFHSVYTGTKGALHNFVASVRRELPALSGIQLTIAQPNMTRTGIVSGELFDEVNKVYRLATPALVADAFLAGVARGEREVFVSVGDHLFKWGERLTPVALDYLFRVKMTDELVDKARDAVETSVFRRTENS